MKVITIYPEGGGGIIDFTADNTDISIDTDLYTADQTEIDTGGDGTYNLRVPYRFFNDTVIFYMINELTNNTFIDEVTATDMLDGTLKLRIQYSFKEGDNFESTIRDMNDKLIWRGRIFATKQKNLQEYLVNPPENGVVKI